MPTTIFRPTSPTNQNRPKMKISNFCVFCPIWIKFGIWANNGPRITWYKFEMATANFYASTKTPHIPSRTIILFRFFCLKIKYFMPNSVHESNTSHLLIPSIQFLPFPSRAKQWSIPFNYASSWKWAEFMNFCQLLKDMKFFNFMKVQKNHWIVPIA